MDRGDINEGTKIQKEEQTGKPSCLSKLWGLCKHIGGLFGLRKVWKKNEDPLYMNQGYGRYQPKWRGEGELPKGIPPTGGTGVPRKPDYSYPPRGNKTPSRERRQYNVLIAKLDVLTDKLKEELQPHEQSGVWPVPTELREKRLEYINKEIRDTRASIADQYVRLGYEPDGQLPRIRPWPDPPDIRRERGPRDVKDIVEDKRNGIVYDEGNLPFQIIGRVIVGHGPGVIQDGKPEENDDTD